jgi:hypothetical protein
MCEIEDTAVGDRKFITWVKYATLDELYDWLFEVSIKSRKVKYKWKRVAVAREICRRETN